MDIKKKSISNVNFGVLLMQRLFTNAELTNPDVNVYGRSAKGKNGIPKEPLDPIRINQIYDICMSFENGTQAEKAHEWRNIKNGMTKKLLQLKKAANVKN